MLLVLVALTACAWFAISIRDTRDIDRATAILGARSHPSAAAARRVSSLLGDATLLNPDRQVELLRGQLALARGQTRAAQRIFLRVTQEEPENLLAWSWLGRTAHPGTRLKLVAFAHFELLAPPIK
jgi:hypothetical protein